MKVNSLITVTIILQLIILTATQLSGASKLKSAGYSILKFGMGFYAQLLAELEPPK